MVGAPGPNVEIRNPSIIDANPTHTPHKHIGEPSLTPKAQTIRDRVKSTVQRIITQERLDAIRKKIIARAPGLANRYGLIKRETVAPNMPNIDYDPRLTDPRCPYKVDVDPEGAKRLLQLVGVPESDMGSVTIRVTKGLGWAVLGSYNQATRVVSIDADKAWENQTSAISKIESVLRKQQESGSTEPIREYASLKLTTDRLLAYLQYAPPERVERTISRIARIHTQQSKDSINSVGFHEGKHVGDALGPEGNQLKRDSRKTMLIVAVPVTAASIGLQAVGVPAPIALTAQIIATDAISYRIDPLEIRARGFQEEMTHQPQHNFITLTAKPESEIQRLNATLMTDSEGSRYISTPLWTPLSDGTNLFFDDQLNQASRSQSVLERAIHFPLSMISKVDNFMTLQGQDFDSTIIHADFFSKPDNVLYKNMRDDSLGNSQFFSDAIILQFILNKLNKAQAEQVFNRDSKRANDDILRLPPAIRYLQDRMNRRLQTLYSEGKGDEVVNLLAGAQAMWLYVNSRT